MTSKQTATSLHPTSMDPMAASSETQEVIRRYHSRRRGPGQCGSINMIYVAAPLPVVWSLVRRFDRPQAYKQFLTGCTLHAGNGGVGSVREITVVSGLPASCSTERLDVLDEEEHVMSFSIVGGEHRLRNYQATTTLHPAGGRKRGTVVVESYVVDVPPGNSAEETCVFVDTIVRCNLRSMASVSEEMAAAKGAALSDH